MQQRKQPFTIEEFKSIYSRVPRLCVDLVIVKDKKVLMTLRQNNGWLGQWHLPGGTVYLKESIKKTIDRIAMEELGVLLEVKSQLGYIEYLSEEKERGYGYSVALVFLCEINSGEIHTDSDAKEFGWFDEMPESTIVEQRNFLKDFLGQTPI